MLRRIAIGLCLLATLVVMIPLVTSTAHNLRAQFSASSHRRRHSRAWWRRHRAMLRRRQAMLARRRAMRALMLARRNGIAPTEPKVAGNHATIPTTLTLPTAPAMTSNAALPNGWAPVASTGAGSSFRIAPAAGPEASATLTLVAPTTGSQPFGREQKKMVGGASHSELRRSVIDRMVSAGGWVVNDRQREISGRRVFEVIAQTPSSNGKPDQVWNFYFAEIEGKVYALTTRTAGNNDKVAADAEKFISAFSPAELQAKKK
ncbi:MAG TPA: hypothetical protein VGW32_09955 [Pyrinomonadaceae bacterium]|nr:hypothetical protein [Pyrinomonadaceae bacterium]